MTSFDFSMYDYSDPVPEQKSEEEPKKAIKHDPFFDMYDPPEEATQPQVDEEEYQGAKPPWLVKAEKQPFKEKLEELPPFGRGIASGATLGYSEKIPGMELGKGNEQQTKLEKGGEFVGAAAPISRAAKAAEFVVNKVPKVLQPLRMLMHGAATGAVYETSKQSAQYTQGKDVDLWQIPKTAAEFAAFTQLLGIGANLAERFQGLSPKVQADILEKGLIPEDLPKSQYDTAKEMLDKLTQKAGKPFRGFPPDDGPGSPPPPPLNKSRITKPEDIGLRPTSPKQSPDLQDKVGDIFSQNKFYNTTQGGQALRNEIMNLDEDVYRGVNDLYKTSRDANKEISESHAQLTNKILNKTKELKAIPEPSDVQKRLIKAQEKIVSDLAEFEEIKDDDGNVIDRVVTGYKNINNQILIDQIQSLRQIIDYDFAHGDTKNIFRPLIGDIEESVIRAAESHGKGEAAEALRDAKAGYKAWVDAFDNPYVRPFRDASNQDMSKLFKSSLDLDEHNMLNKILNLSEKGEALSNASKREIVDKNLSKYFENPRKANPKEFDKALRELEAVITPEQAQQIRNEFKEASKRPDIRAKHKKVEPSNAEKTAAKYEKMEPEDIQRMMSKRSGVRQLRDDFADTPEKKQLFERLKLQKMRSGLREGNIEKDFKGDDLYKFFNKEENFELWSELIGEEEVEALRLQAKEIGNKQVKSEVRNKRLKKAADKVAAFKTLELILNLL